MKKILFMVMIFALIIISHSGKAGAWGGFTDELDYTVALTTYTVDGSTADFALGGYPNITGPARIDKIYISNNSNVVQNVQMYDLATTTTAATLNWEGVVAASGTLTVDYPQFNSYKVVSPAFRRSSTNGTTRIQLKYR